MALKLRKFRDSREAEYFLQGALIGKDISRGVVGLVGLELTFSSPAGSVTFVTANRENDALILSDIKTQVETAIPALKVQQIGGKIVFIEASPSGGVGFPATQEAAKPLLGFDENTAFAGKVYGVAAGTPPAFVSMSFGQDGMLVLLVNE